MEVVVKTSAKFGELAGFRYLLITFEKGGIRRVANVSH
jgi:hypothetical protein